MGEVAGRSDTAFAATVGTAAMPAVVNNANINIQPANIFFMITSSKRGAEVGNSGPAYKQSRGNGEGLSRHDGNNISVTVNIVP